MGGTLSKAITTTHLREKNKRILLEFFLVCIKGFEQMWRLVLVNAIILWAMSIVYIVVGATGIGTVCEQSSFILPLPLYCLVYGCVNFAFALVITGLLFYHLKTNFDIGSFYHGFVVALHIIYSIIWTILCVGMETPCNAQKTAMVALIIVNAMCSLTTSWFYCIYIQRCFQYANDENEPSETSGTSGTSETSETDNTIVL